MVAFIDIGLINYIILYYITWLITKYIHNVPFLFKCESTFDVTIGHLQSLINCHVIMIIIIMIMIIIIFIFFVHPR